MFMLELWMLLATALVVTTAGVDPCEQYANGCSTPLHMPMFYKALYTPACNRHDVCYRCGVKYGITKDTCDSTFLQNMEAACAAHDSSRREIRHILFSSSFSSSSVQKRSACTVIAKNIFYAAVHFFGGLFYRDVDETPTFCSEAAARSCLPS